MSPPSPQEKQGLKETNLFGLSNSLLFDGAVKFLLQLRLQKGRPSITEKQSHMVQSEFYFDCIIRGECGTNPRTKQKQSFRSSSERSGPKTKTKMNSSDCSKTIAGK